MKPTFDTKGDELPKQGLWGTRPKYIHSVGATGKCHLNVSPDSPFSGMFEEANYGIVRLSSAIEPTKSSPLAPGMGLKFLRDWNDSANLVAMWGVDGQPGDWNFFSNEFKNWIKAGTGGPQKALSYKFSSATDMIQTVGLSNWGSMGE